MNPVLLSLLVAPALEETVADWLLVTDAHIAFERWSVGAHSPDGGRLSLAEQVSGRRRRVMFQARLEEDRARALIEEARERFKGTGLRYRLTPVLDAGCLD